MQMPMSPIKKTAVASKVLSPVKEPGSVMKKRP